MSDSPIAPSQGHQPPATVTERDELTAPQVLAELELLRRKSALFERRLATWEDGLAEVRKRLHILETERNPETPEWQEELRDVQHRVKRLEARRLRQGPQGDLGGSLAQPPAMPPAPKVEDAVAITRARWQPEQAAAGDEVTLSALADGIAPNTAVTFHVHSLAAGEAIAEIQGSSDGDHLRGKWKIPKGVSATELYFTVRHEGARAKSSMLVID